MRGESRYVVLANIHAITRDTQTHASMNVNKLPVELGLLGVLSQPRREAHCVRSTVARSLAIQERRWPDRRTHSVERHESPMLVWSVTKVSRS